jgi:hypothetical protein
METDDDELPMISDSMGLFPGNPFGLPNFVHGVVFQENSLPWSRSLTAPRCVRRSGV